MHKSATKCNETIGKWCKNKHGASKIIDTLETYQATRNAHKKIGEKIPGGPLGVWDPITKTKPWFPPHLADIDGIESLT
jgi:hypothetical protein